MSATILHVANFSDRPKGAAFAAVQYKLTNGLIRAGHNVVTFSDRDVARAATPFLSRSMGRSGANRRLLALVEALRPDIILFGHADTIHPATVAAIREKAPGIRLAQWNVDPLFDEGNVERLRSKMDLVDWTFVTTAGSSLQELGDSRWNVAFMPNPADLSIERGRAFETDHLPWDVFYAAGSPNVVRHHCGQDIATGDLVADLSARLPLARFMTPGIGIPRMEGAHCFQAMLTARIGLNISRRNDVRWYSSDRMAHLAGNGLLVMLERATGFDDLFTDEEMGFYSSTDELAGLIDRHSQDHKERRIVACRGWKAYHRMFDATRVARYMLGVMDGAVDPMAFDWRAAPVRQAEIKPFRCA